MSKLAPETLERLNGLVNSDKFSALAPETQSRVKALLGDQGSASEETAAPSDIRANRFIPQLTKGLYDNLPFGKRVISMMPNAAQLQENMESTPAPDSVRGKVGRAVGTAAPTIAMASPFMGGAGAALNAAKFLPAAARGAVAKSSLGFGTYEGTKKAVEGKPGEILPAVGQGMAMGALFGLGGRIGATLMPKIVPGAERIGTAAGMGAAGAITSPDDPLTGAMVAGSLGALSPVSRFKTTEARVDAQILKEINKGLRPTTVGKKTFKWQADKFDKDMITGVKDLVLNKGNITLNGEKGRVPKDLGDTLEAIDQHQKVLWREREAMSGASKETVNYGTIYRKALRPLIKSDAVRINNPAVSEQYLNMIKRARADGNVSVSRGHDFLTDLNKGLDPFYKNPTLVPDSLKLAEARIASELRTHLDKAMERDVGTGYGNLGKRIGALISMRKELLPRRRVADRASPNGFFDITDAWSIPRIAGGIMSGNGVQVLEGLSSLGLKNYMKSQNNANNIIGRMFSYVDKHSGVLTPPQGVVKNAQVVPPVGNISRGTSAPGGIPFSPLSQMGGLTQQTPLGLPAPIPSANTTVRQMPWEMPWNQAEVPIPMGGPPANARAQANLSNPNARTSQFDGPNQPNPRATSESFAKMDPEMMKQWEQGLKAKGFTDAEIKSVKKGMNKPTKTFKPGGDFNPLYKKGVKK